jgi:hypothetical protein
VIEPRKLDHMPISKLDYLARFDTRTPEGVHDLLSEVRDETITISDFILDLRLRHGAELSKLAILRQIYGQFALDVTAYGFAIIRPEAAMLGPVGALLTAFDPMQQSKLINFERTLAEVKRCRAERPDRAVLPVGGSR